MESQLWTEQELKAAVTAYLGMLADETSGRPIDKAAVRRSLLAGPLVGRSAAAVEYRMQNISAVLQDLRRPWIAGYKPAKNVGPTNRDSIAALIMQQEGVQNSEADVSSQCSASTLRELVGAADGIMGIKAVWGAMSSAGMCFGGRRSEAEPTAFFSVARRAATLAERQPYLITVGAGAGAAEAVRGRVINLVRLGTVYGPTRVILGAAEAERLAQWPVAVLAHQIYRFRGDPHVVRDLGFPDLSFFSGLMDGVIRPREVETLWARLESWPVQQVEVPLPSNIYDSGSATLLTVMRKALPASVSSEEGQRLWKQQSSIERDPVLAAEAKRLNRERYGTYTCEACEFANGDRALFDAHHPTPLAAGIRTTRADQLIVLCPICHRRAHRRGNKLVPFSLEELKSWIANGRPAPILKPRSDPVVVS